MKTLIVYSSKTGNTKKLALAMHRELEDCECIPVEDVKAAMLQNFDFFFLGYWVDKGECDALTKAILPLFHEKKVALFATLGAKNNPTYYAMVKQRVEDMMGELHILGHFLCQGSVSQKMIQKYRELLTQTPNDMHMKAQVEAYEEGSTHPDQADIEQAIQFAKSFVG